MIVTAVLAVFLKKRDLFVVAGRENLKNRSKLAVFACATRVREARPQKIESLHI
jgi:hypothetical protein